MSDEEMPRFSDSQLIQLRQDFDKHRGEHNDFVERFEQHEQHEYEWKLEHGKRLDDMLDAQERNTRAISELTAQVGAVVNDTKDLVQLQRDFHGAARVGRGLQDFMLWLVKWGVVGSAVAAGIHWIVTHWKS